jgi:hypothetical protein
MTDIKKRLEWCRGCESLYEREQVRFWKEDGRTRIDPPLKIMQWKSRCPMHYEDKDDIENGIDYAEYVRRYES